MTSILKNASLTTMNTEEFGKEVAVPLKEAIRETRGVTLVGSLPVGRDAASVGLRFDSRMGRGYVDFPGEVLFVGFRPAAYNWSMMDRMVDGVAQRVRGYEIEVEGSGVIDKDVFRLGSMRFTERGRVPIVRDSTATFSTDDLNLRDLLRDGLGIEVGRDYRGQQNCFSERVTYAVFYPSRLLAAVACDLGLSWKIIHRNETYSSMLGNAGFGAITLMYKNDLQSLDEFAYTPLKERRIVQRILSEHHPDYTIPEGLTA